MAGSLGEAEYFSVAAVVIWVVIELLRKVTRSAPGLYLSTPMLNLRFHTISNRSRY